MTRMGRALWIVVAGLFLVVVAGRFVDYLLIHELGVHRAVATLGFPVLGGLGVMVCAYGVSQVGLAASRALR